MTHPICRSCETVARCLHAQSCAPLAIEYADEEFTFAGLMDFVAEWAIVILAGIAALIFGAVVTLPLWWGKW